MPRVTVKDRPIGKRGVVFILFILELVKFALHTFLIATNPQQSVAIAYVGAFTDDYIAVRIYLS